jgi:DNA-binding response OmpR family regulator
LDMAKVLVVDDDSNIVNLLVVLLSREGHETCVANDGKEGLATARQEKPDLIILDVMMPEMDGFSVSGLLFQDPLMRQIPVIILTANGSSRDIFGLVPNVRVYMQKPFEPRELMANVRKLVGTPLPAADQPKSNV